MYNIEIQNSKDSLELLLVFVYLNFEFWICLGFGAWVWDFSQCPTPDT
jgi:hypothetical protein